MRLLADAKEPTFCLAYSPDGCWLAWGGNYPTLKLWNLVTAEQEIACFTRSQNPNSRVSAMAFAPNGRTLAWSHTGCCVISLWDLSDQRELQTFYKNLAGYISRLAFTPDSQFLISVMQAASDRNRGGEVSCWDIPGGRERTAFWETWDQKVLDWGLRSGVWSIAISPDGETFALGTRFGWLSLHEWPKGSVKHHLHVGDVQEMAFSPNSAMIATVIRSNRVTLFDLSNPKQPRNHKVHRGRATCVTFSPDGRILATGSQDGVVILWDVAAWRERASCDWQIGPIHAVAFAPDGMTAAAAGDKGIVIWDVDAS